MKSIIILLLCIINLIYSYNLSINRHYSYSKQQVNRYYSYYNQRYYISLKNSNNNDNNINDINNLSEYIDIDEMISLFDDDILTSKIRNKPKSITGNDIEIDIEISFQTATFGGNENIKIKRNVACNTCNGSGYNQDDEYCSICRGKRTNLVINDVLIEIPPGISENSLIRINEAGNSGINGGNNGNLLVKIKSIKCHPKFKKRGNLDIISEEEIFYYDAILGIKKEVETIHGYIVIDIPSGVKHGEQIKIKDFGIRISELKGDAYIIVKIKIPTDVSEKEKELINQLDKLQKKI